MLLADQDKIHLALGLHNHQPVGNWDRVIEDSYQHSYMPFIDVLERHPAIHLSIHYAGHLLAWLAQHHPEFLKRLQALVARGQLELITGGYFEPILATIPDDDKVGQIRYLSETVRNATGYEPVGMWLSGRVWEPHLAKPIAEAGVKYAVVDDTHFKAAGLRGAELLGYYQTEEQGHVVSMFPINRQLRAMIPFQPPERVIELLRQHATSDGQRLMLYFDDGEKFGGWPDTYQSVYLDGWLERFFVLLEENRDWILCSTINEYREAVKPWGRIYLPTASYTEMQEWALPPDQAALFEEARQTVDPRFQDFLRGGYWRHFLIKYPEANNLHKKMLRVSDQVKATAAVAAPVLVGETSSLPADLIGRAREALWRGQSNDPYWHGVFGGIYLNHLRGANYSALLEAEVLCDELRHHGQPFCELEITDFDRDGSVEALVSTQDQNLYFQPGYGGALFEHDFKARHYNLLDTLARRPEAYHAAIRKTGSKERGLDKLLHYDWYRRLSLLDHFFHPDTSLETLHNMSYGEQGDFINQPYELSTRETDEGVVIQLTRDGHVWVGPEFWPIRVAKEILVPRTGAGFTATYTVTNLWDRPLEAWFGVELNVNVRAGSGQERAFYSAAGRQIEPSGLGAMAHDESIREIGVRDETLGLAVHMSWSEEANLWRFPVETVSRSESGYERVYQSSVLVPNWRLALAQGGQWRCMMKQQVIEL
ncbi:MAG: alpha-amylase [Cyanobacteria bacterium RYN_339]|nr:alpha-amylase [Cyanobacteria bacterium RYN_339]